MKYPRLEINLKKLRENISMIVDICKSQDIELVGVTKCFRGDTEIASQFLKCGVKTLGDSRIENLKKLEYLNCKKMLLRIPMESEIEDVINFSDVSLVSELQIVEALGKAALKYNKIYDVILMIDLGDLREGVLKENTDAMVSKILKIKGINLKGIGTNLTCYGGVIPDKDNLGALVNLKENIEKKYSIKIDVVSGGNSSSLPLVFNGDMPKGITQLRIGEAFLLGKETAYGKFIPNAFYDVFKLKAQLIEVKEKPSVPKGNIGLDAFGNKPTFVDEGDMKRGIVAIGKQDCAPENLIPYEDDIFVLGGSSDHTILNLTHSRKCYEISDIIEFNINYGGLLSLMTSDYVQKVFIK